MEAFVTPARQARAHHRHDLRALTYVVLDDANGGIVRNLSHQGAAVQAVAALRSQQIVRLRFELRRPRLRVEARGRVVWSNTSGQCGVRFLDLSPQVVRQINEWIFANLLESIPQHWGRDGSTFAQSTFAESMFAKSMFPKSTFAAASQMAERTAEHMHERLPEGLPGRLPESLHQDDGLIVSPTPRRVIQLRSPQGVQPDGLSARAVATDSTPAIPLELDWLSQPLSGRSLAWTVDSLIVIAALLVFALVFLSVTHELPKWPQSVLAALAAAIFIGLFYWGFFHFFVGSSMGTRMVRLAASERDEDDEARNTARFR
jgi:PilZ domain/RDD family